VQCAWTTLARALTWFVEHARHPARQALRQDDLMRIGIPRVFTAFPWEGALQGLPTRLWPYMKEQQLRRVIFQLASTSGHLRHFGRPTTAWPKLACMADCTLAIEGRKNNILR